MTKQELERALRNRLFDRWKLQRTKSKKTAIMQSYQGDLKRIEKLLAENESRLNELTYAYERDHDG